MGQVLQLQLSPWPSAELTHFFWPHFHSVGCKIEHNGLTEQQGEKTGVFLLHIDYTGQICVIAEGVLHPTIQDASEDV